MDIKAGDTVVIIAGNDKYTVDKKGVKTQTTGKVVKVMPAENKVIVEGVNKVKKSQKPSQTNQKGGIFEQEAPIQASNVMVLDPKTNKPTRIGYKVVGEGDAAKKVRYAKKSGTVLDK